MGDIRQMNELFNTLYKEQYKKIYAYIFYKIGNIHDAEDLTHEIFLSCYRHIEEYDENKASLVTWLYFIASNRLKNYYRDKKMHVDIEEYSDILPDGINHITENSMFLEECREILADLLEELPDRQRKILIYSYFSDMNSKEIANELGISSGNVRITLMRILEKLKYKMEQRGITKEDIF